MPEKPGDLVPGTLDMLILKTLALEETDLRNRHIGEFGEEHVEHFADGQIRAICGGGSHVD